MVDKYVGCPISEDDDLRSSQYDGLVLVSWPNAPAPKIIGDVLDNALRLDEGLKTETAVLHVPNVPAGRLVYAPTGPIDPDYHDVRVFKQAALKGMQRALKAGIKKPLLVTRKHADYVNSELAIVLGALEALYVPLEVREHKIEKRTKVDYLGVWSEDLQKTKKIINVAKILESGLYVARDIGGADPERMAPPRVAEYLKEVFSNSSVNLTVIDDLSVLSENYPLFEAVNRAASIVERHRGNVAILEYTPEDPKQIKDTVYLVGKGVTYDTGGADIKAGGIMAGMSRDKCGAAAVAGFMQIVKEMKPRHLKVVGAMSMVRNSVGSNCYVADEVIVARSGARVRVGNTDAEGRMVMADVLCQMKEKATSAVNPHLYTIATLTGHACLAAGNYAIVVDNGPAKKSGHSNNLHKSGDLIGDPFEISTLRLDDIDYHRGKAQGDDILQSGNVPSSRTPRGHQTPAAFLLLASGLDKHGSGSEKPLKFSHLDIAGSAGHLPEDPTGSPVLALANLYLL